MWYKDVETVFIFFITQILILHELITGLMSGFQRWVKYSLYHLEAHRVKPGWPRDEINYLIQQKQPREGWLWIYCQDPKPTEIVAYGKWQLNCFIYPLLKSFPKCPCHFQEHTGFLAHSNHRILDLKILGM